MIKKRYGGAVLATLITLVPLAVRAGEPTGGACASLLGDDPYLWLEDVHSARALEWVATRNAESRAHFERRPDFARNLAEARAILFAEDRVPMFLFREGYFWDFWEDEEHPRGIYRRTTYESYLTPHPRWETLLDFDELSRRENENWVVSGFGDVDRGSTRRLVFLSRGGRDARVMREFDFERRAFVADGFELPEGKMQVMAIDENELLAATDEGPGSMTTSGYPRRVRRWRRGQKFLDAPVVYTAAADDLGAEPMVLKHGAERHLVISRDVAFFEAELLLVGPDNALTPLPLPRSAKLIDIRERHVVAQLREAWTNGTRHIPAGSLVRFALDGGDLARAVVLFSPTDAQAVESVEVRRGRVFLNLIEHVRGNVIEVRWNAAGLVTRTLPFPSLGTLDFTPADEFDPTSFATLNFSDLTTPRTYARVDDLDGEPRVTPVKATPPRFTSADLTTEQRFVVSRDGARVPYFLVKKKSTRLDGTNPTILYGYGGFEVSSSPDYRGAMGKLWLERGGVFALANIRGGGEYGPRWHQAALRQNRQRAFDDFIAVAEDLHARRVTSPRHLGIQGGSNGGLLTGTVMVQRPDLFSAALIMVPLLDMARFAQLLAGASWIAEYGDPSVPEDLAYLLRYSPYQNVKAGVRYPTPFLTTSTEDDRVHPGHARKMVAKMRAQGHPVHYFENVNGGHAGAANLEESAQVLALQFTYFWERLGGGDR